MSEEPRVAVVTGAAGGIGACIAHVLAARGDRIVLADVDVGGAEVAAGRIRSAGGDAIVVAADLSDERSVHALFDEVSARWSRIDVLCNNAADIETAITGDAVGLDAAELSTWRRMFDVNLFGAMLATKAAVQMMCPARSGAIVNIVSIGGLHGDVVRSAYNASKAALVQFTRDVATQYGHVGIRCNAIAPGFIMTPRAEAMLPVEAQQELLIHHLSTRLGAPDDIAQAVAYLSSDSAAFVNGALLVVDGGMTAHGPMYGDHARARRALSSGE